ncbi:MAG: BMP family ABC transporter substrate-binding protein [Chloroflexota bacterium]
MRNKFYLWAIVLLIFSSCGGQTTLENEVLAAPEPEPQMTPITSVGSQFGEVAKDCGSDNSLCIAFVIEDGLLEDNSFYQSALNGAKRAEQDLLATVTVIEVDDGPEELYIDQLNSIAEQNYDVIISVGEELLVGTLEASKVHSDIDFIGIDQNQFLAYQNFVGVNFKAEKAAFMAGALAAMISKSDTIGVVLGETNVASAASRYEVGFKAGAQAIDVEKEIIYAQYTGDPENAYNDPEWGRLTAKALMADGADVIFAAGGETAIGALQEVAESEDAFCIGADLDQYIESEESRPCLISSVVRDIESEIFKIIALSVLNDFPTENVIGSYKFAPFYSFDQFITANVKAYIRDIEADIENNSITIDGAFSFQNVPQVNIQRP